MDQNLFFIKLTKSFDLGNLLSKAKRVHGGFMHTMYRLDTASGTYAVKLLNPNVMNRPETLPYPTVKKLQGFYPRYII